MPFVPGDTWRSGRSRDLSIGYEQNTREEFVLQPTDRYAGSYVIGTQGYGKSSFLKDIVGQDIQRRDTAVFFFDPHGDAVDDIIAEMPPEDLARTYIFDMLDEEFPFGINLFGGTLPKSSVEAGKRINRVYGIFKVLWSDVLDQAYLPVYLRNAIIVLLANEGSTLVDMLSFLTKADFRAKMLANLTGYDDVREFWETNYNNLSDGEQGAKVGALVTRLHTLFTGRPLMRNILGQRKTSVNFRQLIEERAIVLIKLPLRELEADARLVGTILVSLLHGATFSYADTPQEQRPGESLYVDEFQNFATSDFSELFTEGRKYKVRLTIAHQFRNQIPPYLRDSTTTARTVVCFRLTPDDASEMARFFPSNETTVRPEDMDPHPTAYLLARGADDPYVRTFIEVYLRPMQSFKRGNKVDIQDKQWQVDWGKVLWSGAKSGITREEGYVSDPTPYLDSLLFDVMRTGNPNQPIPVEVAAGFSNGGRGFFTVARHARNSPLLESQPDYWPYPIEDTGYGYRWATEPRNAQEQFLHFVFYLRQLMEYIAEHPLGRETETSTGDVAGWLSQLPVRAAFVRSGDDVGVIRSHDTPPKLTGQAWQERMAVVQAQTRQRFCKPREDVEGSATHAQPPNKPAAGPTGAQATLDTTELPDRWE